MQTENYIVGKFYPVPTVLAKIYECLYAWPVIGPMHNDQEIIGFAFDHYHIDWRFVPNDIRKRVVGRYQDAFAIVLMTSDKINAEGLPAPIMRRLKCKQDFGAYPRSRAAKVWLKTLEDKYQDCKLKTLVCPHQGVPLDRLPCSHKGTVTCPGHGLEWNLATGELVRFI